MKNETFDRTQPHFTSNNNINNSTINNVRGISSGSNSTKETANNYTYNKGDTAIRVTDVREETNVRNININIFRYKFTNDFIDELYKFSKIHQYDHRKDFKEAWEVWVNENNDIIFEETTRLTDLGYDGDILDKMFKSARYYFRKKGTEKKEPRQRRCYIGIQKELLQAMDAHINYNINEKLKNYKPSDGFIEFCNENITLLKEEVNRLVRYNISDPNEIKKKIKKTYKNRYFIITNK